MKKQAILIMAYNNIWTLHKIIECLDSKYFDFYIHIDKKSDLDINDIKKSAKISNIYVYKEINVGWADISQTKCELFLMKKATLKGNYLYYHLLSGSDMPIKNSKYIYNFFANNYPKEFVHFFSDTLTDTKKIFYSKYHFCMKHYRNIFLSRAVNRLLLLPQYFFKIDRIKNSKEKIVTGANWFSISDNLVRYVLSKEKWIIKTYKYTRSSDESFLQTIIYNSRFKDYLYNMNYNDDYIGCMRLIDWKRGNPYTYRKDDFNSIINSDYMFVRKVDENVDKEIIKMIYNYCNGDNYEK